LIQDSNEDRPFLVVGLDLLLSMGIGLLHYIKPGFQFEAGINNLEENAGAWRSDNPSPQYGIPSCEWLDTRNANEDDSYPEEFHWIVRIDLSKPRVLWI